MEIVVDVIQIIIALGILNVWIFRYGKATTWRGGDAKNMKEEFAVYGLPGWFMGVIGFLKLLFAVSLIAGVWIPVLTKPAAVGMAVLMLGAVAMHFKVKDPLKKSLPALTLLILSIAVAVA
ncbi:MAG: DoxX family protein [Gemmatimonadales bacterium]|nr:DoxX family protein [Gemmatimonadales bacterium]